MRKDAAVHERKDPAYRPVVLMSQHRTNKQRVSIYHFIRQHVRKYSLGGGRGNSLRWDIKRSIYKAENVSFSYEIWHCYRLGAAVCPVVLM